MAVQTTIRKNAYYDSVTLMLITKDLAKLPGVVDILVGMATELNKELADNLNLMTPELEALSANDFFVTASLTEETTMEKLTEALDDLLTKKKSSGGSSYRPATLQSALNTIPDLNLALISLPGRYAAEEVEKALDAGLHVMLFSDNVSIEDEKRLKEKAVSKDLLMMGPDCGTAMINHVPLAFCNVVSAGNIGIVGASGTGTQEIMSLIDQLGGGVSQVIGTGGRDLKSEIGGLMMLKGLEALTQDPETKVIVLVSKPPAPEIAEKVLSMVKAAGKPVVVDFIGGDRRAIEAAGAAACISLEDAARKAVALSRGEELPGDFSGFDVPEADIDALADHEANKKTSSQKYLRGLFTGGTLADEAMKLLGPQLGTIWSNIPLKPEDQLKDVKVSSEHTIIDFGDDAFTVGRPHPMIDPSTRSERIVEEAAAEVAVMLMDVVLGYGSHPDPAGEVAAQIKDARDNAAKAGGDLTVIASVCGTEGDPQGLKASRETLSEAGAIVMPSNAQAVRLAAKIMKAIQNKQ
ncbi:acyl-CoA synthetase FdrA [Acidaminobacter hydrogenoformans]|uniref:Succinyl-CoA synthetase, alpha subunit n=1 Tax=Acidaminobacter hydrogenoformans DSM 2784 TaxID=1120920 RepID=A0A1G5RVW4_9FIRM|nr:acyl-CoA synthetase FdrA [Acidaminobacter hydrogenoformans]SCZ78275.1 Succinyl-CoA synthetase, alpha subunit [Acidaminobacter hydrogenoformans DSM 2784]